MVHRFYPIEFRPSNAYISSDSTEFGWQRAKLGRECRNGPRETVGGSRSLGRFRLNHKDGENVRKSDHPPKRLKKRPKIEPSQPAVTPKQYCSVFCQLMCVAEVVRLLSELLRVRLPLKTWLTEIANAM